MQESGGILIRSVWQEFGVSRWCDWDYELRFGVEWVAREWISVTTVERNIFVTYLNFINFISDYHTLCVNNFV
jgi:hypothetical protein